MSKLSGLPSGSKYGLISDKRYVRRRLSPIKANKTEIQTFQAKRQGELVLSFDEEEKKESLVEEEGWLYRVGAGSEVLALPAACARPPGRHMGAAGGKSALAPDCWGILVPKGALWGLRNLFRQHQA